MNLTDQEKKFHKLYTAMTNNGYISEASDERLTFKDVVTSEDIAPFVPKVVRKIIVDAIEPNLLIVDNLFTKVNLPNGQMVEIGQIGAITAGKIAQGADYPTSTLATDVVGASTAITISKYGCAIHVAKEVIDENQFDIVALWLRAAGAALARLKEALGIRLIDEMGISIFDNSSPTTSELGILNGRNIAGAANGTMNLNDVFDMWAYLALRGFTPDTIIMSPLAWKVFSVDPQMREIVLNGAVLATRRMPLGSGAKGFADPFAGLGLKTDVTGGSTGVSAYTQNFTPVNATFNIPPNYLPTPLKVIISHLVPFTERAGKKPVTDIIMADSQRCGILVQRDLPTTEEQDVFSNDTHIVKIYEKYGMGIFDQGKAIGVARDVVVDYNYVFENANTQVLAPITALPSGW